MTDYESAGVSIEAGDRAVELMKQWVEKARRPEVVGGIGGFAGLFDASALKSYRRPLLATSADGVGTKVAIAQAMDVHDTIGFDLVGMLVDDLVVCGAEPLFLTDYIACGQVVPERIADIVKGIAQACAEAGTALLGGETAEHPGLLDPDEYDVAGSTTGVVEADSLLGAELVRAGDVVVAMASSGLHSNGYSLVRHVLLERRRLVARPGRARAGPHARCRAAHAHSPVHEAVPRPRRTHRGARDVAHHRRRPGRQPRPGRAGRRLACGSTAPPGRCPPVFSLVADVGDVAQADLEQALNIGVGMVALVAARCPPMTPFGCSASTVSTPGLPVTSPPPGVHGPGGSVTLVGDHA